MERKSFVRKVVFSALTFGLVALSASAMANTMAQNCELRNTCPVPGNDGGITQFIVRPSTGLDYVCEVKSNNGKLRFALTGGGDFSLTQGFGLGYVANPKTIIEIKGRFKHPNDPKAQGKIKITRLPFSSEGTATCYAKS